MENYVSQKSSSLDNKSQSEPCYKSVRTELSHFLTALVHAQIPLYSFSLSGLRNNDFVIIKRFKKQSRDTLNRLDWHILLSLLGIFLAQIPPTYKTQWKTQKPCL